MFSKFKILGLKQLAAIIVVGSIISLFVTTVYAACLHLTKQYTIKTDTVSLPEGNYRVFTYKNTLQVFKIKEIK